METSDSRIAEGRQLVGVSNTYMGKGKPWLGHVRPEVEAALDGVRRLVVIPYALADRDWYTSKLEGVFKGMGVDEVVSPHQHPGSERSMLEDAEAIYIGGGNTPLLVANLRGLRHEDDLSLVDGSVDACQQSLVDAIRMRVAAGMPVIGASAGWNVMFGDIRTTNDMHIVPWRLKSGIQVSCMSALGLFPRHMSGNPHYLEKVAVTADERDRAVAVNAGLAQLIDHQGESRADRLNRVLEQDHERIILALREGACVVVDGMGMVVKGATSGLVFRHDQELEAVNIDDDLSKLLVA